MFTNSTILTIFAFLPIAFILFAFYFMNWPLMQAAWTTVLIACFTSIFIWQTPLLQVLASVVQGLFHGAHYSLLLFASVWLSAIFSSAQITQSLRKTFSAIHPDPRVQAIVVCTLFGTAVESMFCFSPSLLICTLVLGGLQFPPACACMIAAVGTIVGTSFGAMGHSILTGVEFGLRDPVILSNLTSQGITHEMLYREVAAKIGLIQSILGTFTPIILVMLMTRFFGRNKSWTEGLSIAPFAIFCGLALTVPYALTAIFVGPEFPSLAGGIVGLAIVFLAISTGFLLPHDRWNFPPPEEWPTNWVGGKYQPAQPVKLPVREGWMAFLMLAIALIITRIPGFGIREWLLSMPVDIPHVFGSNVDLFSYPLYLPAIVLFIMGWFFAWAFKVPTPNIREAFGGWATALVIIGLANVVLTTVTAVYMNSSINHAGLPGMPYYLVHWLTATPGGQYIAPFLSPFVAALGTFAAANNFNSSMIYSTLQYYGADAFHFSASTFLALQVAGACVGNLMSDHYFAAPGAVIGYLGWEGPSIRRIVFLMLIYLIFLGCLGILLTQFPEIFTSILGPDIF